MLCVPIFYIESKLGPCNVPSYLVIVEKIWILKLTLFLMLFILGDTIVVMGLVLFVNCSLHCTVSRVADAFDYVSWCSGHDAYIPFPLPLPLSNADLAKCHDKCPWSIKANCNRNIPNKTLAMEIWSQTWWSHAHQTWLVV